MDGDDGLKSSERCVGVVVVMVVEVMTVGATAAAVALPNALLVFVEARGLPVVGRSAAMV